MRPTQVLAFLLVVLAGLGLVGLLVPEGGIPFSNAFTFRAPDPATVLFDKEPEQVDISDILAVTTDSAAVLEPETLLDSLGYDSVAANIPFVFRLHEVAAAGRTHRPALSQRW